MVADASAPPGPTRRPRPPLLEFAAAILVVGGLTGILGVIGSTVPAAPQLDVLVVGLNLLTIVVGLLVRTGRAWILAVNVAAVVLFIEFTALPSPFAIVFTAMDTIVVFALIRHRDWFQPPTAEEPAA